QHVAALGSAGAHVVAIDRAGEGAREVARKLAERTGVDAIGGGADIDDPQRLTSVSSEVLARFGQGDVLVNNPAINDMVEGRSGAPVPFEQHPLEDWRRTLEVNVTGTFLCCQIFGAQMARRGSGSIINIASTYGIVAPNQSLYRDAGGVQKMYKS